MLFSTDTLALPFIYAIVLEIMERKELKRAPESRKYAESSAAAAGCPEEIIPRIPEIKEARQTLPHTSILAASPSPLALPSSSSFRRARTRLCQNYPSEMSRLTTKLGLSSPLSSLSEEGVMPSTCLHQLP